MQEHCAAAIQVFHQIGNKLWPVIKASNTLQRSFFVLYSLLKCWHLTWTGWGGTLWQYLPVQLYTYIYLVACTFLVCVKLKNKDQLKLLHLEGCKSEALFFVVIGNLQCQWVSWFPLQLQSDRVFFTLIRICKTSAIAPSGKTAIYMSALLFLWWCFSFLISYTYYLMLQLELLLVWACLSFLYMYHCCIQHVSKEELVPTLAKRKLWQRWEEIPS